MRIILTFVFSALIFFGCESKSTKPLVVSANLWIGYSPLYYAYDKGWLRENNIKFVRTISLTESLKTLKSGASNVLCGTQYEIAQISQNKKEKGSIILLDRSNGGDYILGNRSIDKLKVAKKINVYLEVDSVNAILLKYFTKKYGLKDSQINLINSSQAINMKLQMKKNPTLIITYNPYNIKLEKHGYKVLGSTKESGFLVIDAIYLSAKIKKEFTKEIDSINFLLYNSLKALNKNPREYFKVINKYYGYTNFNEFEDAIHSIQWIYTDYPSQTIDFLKNYKLIRPHK